MNNNNNKILIYIINDLLKIKWWTWSTEKIKKNIHLLSGNNIDIFLENHKKP